MNKHTRSVSLIDGHIEDRDAEVIKALECLKGVEVECIGCAYQKCGYPMCREEVALDALDLINHQQAQIKKLEKIERLATKTIEKQDAEIELLQKTKQLNEAEIERFTTRQKPTGASGFKNENGKVVFFTNMLSGYRHEYTDIDQVVKTLNELLHEAYSKDEILFHYNCAKDDLRTAKSEAIKEFAERLCEGRVSNDPVVIAVKTELKMTEVSEW